MRLYPRGSRNFQSGDTIVEVLISIAVLSLVLTAAFVTSNRSLQGVRDAQEHSEALSILQGQVETLLASDKPTQDSIFDGADNKNFCLAQDPATSLYQRVDLGGTDATSIPSAAADQLSSPNYPGGSMGCQNGRYFLSIAYDSTQDDLFTFRARWDGLNARDEVSLNYRWHPGAVAAAAPAPPSGVTPCEPVPSSFGGLDVAKDPFGDPVSHIWYTVNFSKATWTYTLSAAQQANFQTGCAASISITTGDPDHPDPVEGNQANEQLFAVFEDAAGATLCTTNPTPDLPTPQKTIGPSPVGICTFYQVPTKIVFKHCSLYTLDPALVTQCKKKTNSINPVSIDFNSP